MAISPANNAQLSAGPTPSKRSFRKKTNTRRGLTFRHRKRGALAREAKTFSECDLRDALTEKVQKSAIRETRAAAALDKWLFALNSTVDVESFWKAVQRLISGSFRTCNLGMTLQHNPVRPLTAKWVHSIPDGLFDSAPLEHFLRTHPRRKIVRETDVFPVRDNLVKTTFYRNYMKPLDCEHAIGLFFWRRQRLACVIIIMRSGEQGSLSEAEMKLLRRLYSQFDIALRRISSLEREQSARTAFETFLRRLPLPTMLIRWNLGLTYQNKAAREFCLRWREGPEKSRLVKATAEVPEEILDGCRRLKEQWERSTGVNATRPSIEPAVFHHPEWKQLRVVISITHLNTVGVTPPHFLVQCEQIRSRGMTARRPAKAQLSHLARLTPREQEVTRLACEGHTNQEIADETGLSLQMVKKHLHAIFRKLEVTSRSRLITLMR